MGSANSMAEKSKLRFHKDAFDPSLRAPHPGPRRHRAGLFFGSHVFSHYTFGTVFLCHSRSERREGGRVRGDSGVENDGCGCAINFFAKKQYNICM
jgi:hypothetical protein